MGWLWLGLLIGLLVGAGAVALLLRAVGRLTGTDLRGVGRLVVDGLTPGRRREGVAAQRALARRLKRAGERTASGRRVAAEELTVHVSPEDHDAIEEALGLDAAQADLAEFYREHASSANWIVGAEPQVVLVRDISLRPRQAFVRATTRAAAAGGAAQPEPRATPERRAPDPWLTPEPEEPPEPEPEEEQASPLPVVPPRREPLTPAVPARPADPDEAPTDVLPRGLLDDSVTAVYPAAGLLGDLVAVHGTDVRTVSPDQGALRIGRARQNDLVLDRPGVGRDHVVVEARGDAWWVVPGTSQGGTKLDGVAIDAPTPLRRDAVLELGRGVRIRLSVGPV